jgi:hypothetical protein
MNSKRNFENICEHNESAYLDVKTGDCHHIACCDCGLTHTFTFQVIRGNFRDLDRIKMLIIRNDIHTVEVREANQFDFCKVALSGS